MSVEFRLAASVPLALIPIFLSQGSLARRILVVTLAHLVLFFAELPGGALWMSMTGTPVAVYGGGGRGGGGVASPKSGATMSVRRCSKSSWIGI